MLLGPPGSTCLQASQHSWTLLSCLPRMLVRSSAKGVNAALACLRARQRLQCSPLPAQPRHVAIDHSVECHLGPCMLPWCAHCIGVGPTCTVLTSTLVMTASKDTLGCCVLLALEVVRGARLAGGGGWLEATAAGVLAAVVPAGGGGPGRAVVAGGGSAAGACGGGGSAGGGGTNSTKTSAGTGTIQCASVPLSDAAQYKMVKGLYR